MSAPRVSVLDCGSPLPLFHRNTSDAKRQRADAVQNLAELSNALAKQLLLAIRKSVFIKS
jgi:hypothetical protein